MYDTSKLTLDTPVKIKIMESGIYVPELTTYTPLECYTSIDNCIAIMNRGVEIEFPQQEKNEITKKIEDILLDYEEAKQQLKKSHGDVGTNIEKALNIVQEINESKLTEEDIQNEKDAHIFDFDDIANRIANNLQNDDNMFRFNAMFNNDKDVIDEAAKIRHARERNKLRKKEALEIATLESQTLNRLSQMGQFENSFNDQYDLLDYYDVTPDIKK